MISEKWIRTSYILGEKAVKKLWTKKVLVFGCGGVGCCAIEALARSNIGTIGIVDNDDYEESNFNRQLYATKESIGRKKVDVAKERIASIDETIHVKTYPVFYLPQTKTVVDIENYDYVIDAIDTVSAKLDIIQRAKKANIPIISAMGCGNRMDPFSLQICDIYETSNDKLATVMRRELRKREISSLKVLCSKENAIKNENQANNRVPGSSAFVPTCAGFMMASQAVKELL